MASPAKYEVAEVEGETVKLREVTAFVQDRHWWLPDEARPPSEQTLRTLTGTRRRNEVTPEQRASALAMYEASKGPKALEWTAEQLGISRSTAHNWIKTARQERTT